MYLSKLISVLKLYKRAQFKRLCQYTSSPFFKVYPPSAVLLNYLAPLYPAFAAHKITIAAIAKHHPSLHTRLQQETAASRLLLTMLKQMSVEDLLKDRHTLTRHQLKHLQQLDLTTDLKKEYQRETKLLSACPEQGIDTFLNRHLLTELEHSGFNAKRNRKPSNNILPVVETLDAFYAIKKLRYLCEALNRRMGLGASLKEHEAQIPALLRILENYTNEQHPYVYLFVNACQMLMANSFEESEEPYKLIKQYVKKQTATTLPEGVAEVINYANSHCLHWFNKGHRQAGDEYLWWTDLKIKHQLLLENNKLLPVYFRNIINIAVLNKKNTDWIKNFIANYAHHLPHEEHDTYLAFGNGLYHYATKDYREAIRCFLIAREKEEITFNCVIRRWHWISAYEFDANDNGALYNELINFEKHIKRNKKELGQAWGLFNQFIAYAMKLLHSANSEKLQDALDNLLRQEHFAGKPWLLEQFAIKNKKTRVHSTRVKSASTSV